MIINNGSFQVNFTKPNSATILCTNSQWLREDATEVPVGRVAVPKPSINTVHKPVGHRFGVALPREYATEASVGWVAVPKPGQKPPSPRGDGSEVPVGMVAVPKTGQKNALPREDATEMPVGKVAVPKTGRRSI